jgi:hypothetical protein
MEDRNQKMLEEFNKTTLKKFLDEGVISAKSEEELAREMLEYRARELKSLKHKYLIGQDGFDRALARYKEKFGKDYDGGEDAK